MLRNYLVANQFSELTKMDVTNWIPTGYKISELNWKCLRKMPKQVFPKRLNNRSF